jgi:hypothetical protein
LEDSGNFQSIPNYSFGNYTVNNSQLERVERPELLHKLHKQHSAPLLNTSCFLEESDNFHGARNTDWSLDDNYSLNNTKFAQDLESEHALEDLLGEHAEALPAFSDDYTVPNKRHVFQQRSVRSIIDEAQQTHSTPAWFNNSCPNLSVPVSMGPQASLLLPMDEPEEEPLDPFSRPNMFTEFQHSQPLFAETPNKPSLACGKPNRFLDKMRSKRSQSARQLNARISRSFDGYESPLKLSASTAPINHEDIILSPIGDGSTHGLFELLKGMEDGSDRNAEDLFDPIPF